MKHKPTAVTSEPFAGYSIVRSGDQACCMFTTMTAERLGARQLFSLASHFASIYLEWNPSKTDTTRT